MPPKKRGGAAGRGRPRKQNDDEKITPETTSQEPAEQEKSNPDLEQSSDKVENEAQETNSKANGTHGEPNKDENDAEKTEEGKDERHIVKIKGYPSDMSQLDMQLMLYDIFANELKISPLPKVKLPKVKERYIYAKCETSDDKKKILETLNSDYKYQDKHPLQVTSGWFGIENKAIGVLDKEAALDVLFKYRNLHYKEQLNLKMEETEKMVKGIFESLKKSNPHHTHVISKYPEIGAVVPQHPIYGYSLDNSFCIAIDPETKDVVVGLRALENNNERIVPIDLCPSVPKIMADAVKDFVAHLNDYGLEPFNYKEGTGNILAVQIKMNTLNEMILSITIPKENTFLREFSDLLTPDEISILKEKEAKIQAEKVDQKTEAETKNAEENATEEKMGENENEVEEKMGEHDNEVEEKMGENENEVKEEVNKAEESQTFEAENGDEDKGENIGRRFIDIKPGLLKYFEERGKAHGVVSVYVNWTYCNHSNYWANRLFSHLHVCGEASIEEQTLNLWYDLLPYRQWSPRTSMFGSILKAIDSLVHFDKSTSVAIATEHHLVALYYAKRCRDAINISMWSLKKNSTQAQVNHGFLSWCKKLGVRNLEAIATKSSTMNLLERTSFAHSDGYKVAVIWGFSKIALLQKLCAVGTKKIVVVLNVNGNSPSIQEEITKYFQSVTPSMIATKIVPVDVNPHGSEFVLVCCLEEVMRKPMSGNKRRPEPIPSGNNKRRRNFNDGPRSWNEPHPNETYNSLLNPFTDFMQKQMSFNQMLMQGGFRGNDRNLGNPPTPQRFGRNSDGYANKHETNFTPRNRNARKDWKSPNTSRSGGFQEQKWSAADFNKQNFSNNYSSYNRNDLGGGSWH